MREILLNNGMSAKVSDRDYPVLVSLNGTLYFVGLCMQGGI